MNAPSTSLAQRRLLAQDAGQTEVSHEPVDAADVAAGSPTAGTTVLREGAGVEVGVWEITPGTVTDTEADEVFVVVAGRGTVELEDGSSIGLRPGTVVRLVAGDRTRWVVEETLRKVYLTPTDPGA